MTLGRIRKALTPFVIGIVSPVISWVATGHLDLVTERLAVAGALTGLLVYFVPNDEPLPPLLSPPLPVVRLGNVAPVVGPPSDGGPSAAFLQATTPAPVHVPEPHLVPSSAAPLSETH